MTLDGVRSREVFGLPDASMAGRAVSPAFPRLFAALGYRPPSRWALAASVDTTADVLDRWTERDHFRHLLRVAAAHTTRAGRVEAGLFIPLDFEARDEQSPMIGVGFARPI